MQLRMWTYDYAREQSPTLDHLRRLCSFSLEAGYNALGLYLEHRFAYPSAPWAHGDGAMQPETIRSLQEEFPELNLIPFINLLGHFEGMLYTEYGKRFAEEKFKGLQACPSNEAFVELAKGLLDDTIDAFKSDLIHIGGDETNQLGKCPKCEARVEQFEEQPGIDGKAQLYGHHFGPLSRHVLSRGRTPGVWGDMFLEHPQALGLMPREAVIFDWQYFSGPKHTSSVLGRNHPVVFCPSLQTYNACWFHLAQSEMNVEDHVQAALESENPNVKGICITTWECGLFGNYNTILPALKGAGKLLSEPASVEMKRIAEETKFKTPFTLTEPTRPASTEQPVAAMTRTLIEQAVRDGATRIELTPASNTLRVDFYTPFGTYIAMTVPSEVKGPLLARLRNVSNIPPAGKRQRKGSVEGIYRDKPFRFNAKTKEIEGGTGFVLSRPTESFERPYHDAVSTEFLGAYAAESPEYGEWARLIGVELQKCGGVFAWRGQRSSLKCRLLLYSNPFLAWMHHGTELTGPMGDQALSILESAIGVAPNSDARGVAQFIKSAVEFVRYAEQARQAYASELPGVAISCLSPARQIFDDLSKIAKATQINAGGSVADIERCRAAKEHVERVILRIKSYGDGSLGYLPAFEHLTHPKFMPHDQGAWWLINTWANE